MKLSFGLWMSSLLMAQGAVAAAAAAAGNDTDQQTRVSAWWMTVSVEGMNGCTDRVGTIDQLVVL